MDVIKMGLQIVIAGGIINVWFLRFGRSTNWRGGDAANLQEEFAVYGLPIWFMYLIGLLKVSCAIGLVAGLVYPELVQPSAIGMAALMTGAVAMHFKVGDPVMRALPAFLMLLMSLAVAFL